MAGQEDGKSFFNLKKITEFSLKLQTKVIIIFICIVALVLVLVGGVLPAVQYRQNLGIIREDYFNQARHLDFALSNFIAAVKNDVLELSRNAEIRGREDGDFTSFLDADAETFQYNIGAREQGIIDILNGYRLTHPYVSSVYMGRENGSFVRSHKRAQPTAYDPRERPWYVLAAEHPGEVVMTEPYRGLTTSDVNLGVVTALRDEDETVYGVVGADITLVNLTNYIAGFDIGRGGKIMLVDRQGVILAASDPALLSGKIGDMLGERSAEFLAAPQGDLELGETHLFFRSSRELGWKIAFFLPRASLLDDINKSIWRVLPFVIAALFLVSVVTIILINRTMIRPLAALTAASRKIAETGDTDQPIDTKSGGEIGVLARSFKAMVDELKASQKRLLDIIEFLPDPTFAVDKNGDVIIWNNGMEALTGLKAGQVAGKNADRSVSDLGDNRRPLLLDLLSGVVNAASDADSRVQRQGDMLTAETDNVLINGRRCFLVSKARLLYDVESRAIGAIESIRDVTEKKLAEIELDKYRLHLEDLVKERTRDLEVANRKLEDLATKDPLTGIYNRRYFYEIGEQEMARANRNRTPLSVVMFDIDYFKHINDTYGHPIGDEVLKTIAKTMRENIRLNDRLARLGGEEFYILMPETSKSLASSSAERFRILIEKIDTVRSGTAAVRMTASFGVCQLEQGDSNLEALLQRVDIALYRAKDGGRNRVVTI